MEEKSKKEAKKQKNDDIRELIAGYVAEAVKDMKESFGKDLEERIAAERSEAEKLAAMSSEERAKAEIEKSRKEFESERAQYVSEKSEFEAAKELQAQNLPVAFAKFVADADKEILLDNIQTFKSEFLKAIEAGLTQRLQGTLPRISKEKEQPFDPFLYGLGV